VEYLLVGRRAAPRASHCVALLALAVGCSDTHAARRDAGGSEMESPEAVLLTSVEPEPAGSACPGGGQRVRAGLDQNGDGTLQSDEVRAATLVCERFEQVDAEALVDAGPAEHGCADKPVGRRTLDTDSPLDLAIVGAGFFMLRAPIAQPRLLAYTRLGRFHVDRAGYLVDGAAYRLQGYGVDAAGGLKDAVDDLSFSVAALPAQATSRIDFAVNLDSSVTPAPAWNPSSPATTSNFSSSWTVYDSLGKGHQITLYFAKDALGAWSWHACVDGGEIDGAAAGVPFEGARGELSFTVDGALASERRGGSSWSFLGARGPQQIVFDFGTSLEERGSGLDGSTHFASPSSTSLVHQDGHAAGSLSTIEIDASGAMTGVYSNGQGRALGQLVLAAFLSPDSLLCGGDDHWLVSDESGEPLLGLPGSIGHGVIRARALELR
jgi:flagellar hook protein FlgE